MIRPPLKLAALVALLGMIALILAIVGARLLQGGQFEGDFIYGVTRRTLVVAFWIALLPIEILLLYACATQLAEYRRCRAGLCRGCGYDLRASKDRCPECGRVIESADTE